MGSDQIIGKKNFSKDFLLLKFSQSWRKCDNNYHKIKIK